MTLSTTLILISYIYVKQSKLYVALIDRLSQEHDVFYTRAKLGNNLKSPLWKCLQCYNPPSCHLTQYIQGQSV